MNVWIIDSKRGITLVYYSPFDLSLNEGLVSGLISALNQLTMVEFKQPIESIDMGGFKWIYIVDLEADLMFVMADSIDTNTETIKGRLSVIKDKFMIQFIPNKQEFKKNWTGDVSIFKPYEEVISDYYNQWTQAGNIDGMAKFYDIIGILQQMLNLIKNVVENHLSGDLKEKIYQKMKAIFDASKSEEILQKEPELGKMKFNEMGFNIFNLNPMTCDEKFVREHIFKMLSEIIKMFKKEIGDEESITLFHREGILNYLVSNLKLIKNLNMDHYLLNLVVLGS